MDQTLRMRQVRTHVTTHSPFVASLMLSLIFIPDPTVKTMETDGVSLYYNPYWFDSLRFTQGCFAVAHEAFHCAANHPLRIGNRGLLIYNHAADYVTNPLVFEAGFDDPPEGILLDQRFLNMSVERVYNILDREKPPEQGGGKDQKQAGGGSPQQGSQPQGDPKPGDNIPDDLKQMDVGGCGGFFPPRNVDGKPFSTEQKERLRDKWEMTATHAKMVAKRIGNCPGSAETIVNEIQNPKADWKIVMRRFMQAMASQDYSWLRPDRRLVHRKLWVPDLVADGMPGMAVGCDTSVSMTPRMLATIETEFNSILLDTMPAWVDVFLGDTEIHRQVRYYPNEYPIKFSFPGRGGTRVQPFFDAIDKLEYTPVCFVHFSDLEIPDFPAQEPAYPVLWASTEKTEIPWGELVMVDEV